MRDRLRQKLDKKKMDEQQAILSEDMEDDLTWLRYWVVLALVSLVEMAVDPMVDYFPAYLLAKCAFLIWCMAPSPNNGASFVFTQVSRKYVNMPYAFVQSFLCI